MVGFDLKVTYCKSKCLGIGAQVTDWKPVRGIELEDVSQLADHQLACHR